jgi:MFS transporter, putative metabolite:H+ symporter
VIATSGALLGAAVGVAIAIMAWRTAAGDVAATVARLASTGVPLQFAIGVITALAGAAVIGFEGGLGSPRALLRAAGVFAVLASGMVSLSYTDLAVERLAAADAATLPDTLAAVRLALLVHAALGLVTALAFVVALRLRRPMAQPPRFIASERRLLLLLGSVTFFEGYDRFIVTLALPYIGRDVGAGESTLGWALFWIHLGALLSLPLAMSADRWGRRLMLLVTVVGYTLATFATAFTTSVETFVACQLVANMFLIAELSLAHVVVAEEFSPEVRGFGLGVIGGMAGLGSGVAAMLFPLFQATPLGWRGLYLVGIIPLAIVAWLRRALPETRRFESVRASRPAAARSWRALLRRPYALPLLVLVFAALATWAGISPAYRFFSYVATNTHGFTPTQISMAIVVGGGIGILGWPIGGRLADVLGRKLTGSIGLALLTAAIVLLYRGGSAWITPAFSMLVFAEAWVNTTIITALATESFPTAVRSSAKAVVMNASIVGGMLGLSAVALLSDAVGGLATVIASLAALNVVSLVLIWTLPETAGLDLDRVDPDEPAPAEPEAPARTAQA